MTREQQIEHLDRAIGFAPKRAWYYETRAIYRIDLGRFMQARDDLDRDIALQDRPYAHFLRGLVLCHYAPRRKALADFDVAIARQPSNAQFYRGRSMARSEEGDLEGALADAEHLVSVAPQQAESYYARGVALAAARRFREAIADFDRAARMRPELVYVIEARGAALFQTGDVLGADVERLRSMRLREEQRHCAPCVDPYRY